MINHTFNLKRLSFIVLGLDARKNGSDLGLEVILCIEKHYFLPGVGVILFFEKKNLHPLSRAVVLQTLVCVTLPQDTFSDAKLNYTRARVAAVYLL